MENFQLSPEEIALVKQHRERQQVEGNLTETERRMLEAERNKPATYGDLDPARWSKLTREQQAGLRDQIHRDLTGGA